MTDQLPPDPLPEVKAHCMGTFARTPCGKILVACLDCENKIVGEACCETDALSVLGEHARRMGTT